MKTLITLQPFITQSFSKPHHAPHVILHQVVHILLCNCWNGRLKSREWGIFRNNCHVCFIGLYRPACIQQSKSFYNYIIEGYLQKQYKTSVYIQ